MAYILKKIGKTMNVPFKTFECDNVSDLASIPVAGVPMGSRCYVINEGVNYALNSAGQWKKVPIASGDTPGGGGDSDPDIIYDGGDEDEV